MCIRLIFVRPSIASYPRRSIDRENFMVLSGPCASTGGCVTSPNHPHNYGNSESCEILAPEEPLYFTQFATEEGKDALTFGGQAYSGSAGPPQGATTSAMILWRSDAAATASGWRACTADGLNFSGVSNKNSDVFVAFYAPRSLSTFPHKVPMTMICEIKTFVTSRPKDRWSGLCGSFWSMCIHRRLRDEPKLSPQLWEL